MLGVFDQSGDDGSGARSLKSASARANLRGQMVTKMVRGPSRRWPMTWKLWSFLVKMMGEVDQIKGDENSWSNKWWWTKCSKPKTCIGTRKPKRSSGHEDGKQADDLKKRWKCKQPSYRAKNWVSRSQRRVAPKRQLFYWWQGWHSTQGEDWEGPDMGTQVLAGPHALGRV